MLRVEQIETRGYRLSQSLVMLSRCWPTCSTKGTPLLFGSISFLILGIQRLITSPRTSSTCHPTDLAQVYGTSHTSHPGIIPTRLVTTRDDVANELYNRLGFLAQSRYSLLFRSAFRLLKKKLHVMVVPVF